MRCTIAATRHSQLEEDEDASNSNNEPVLSHTPSNDENNTATAIDASEVRFKEVDSHHLKQPSNSTLSTARSEPYLNLDPDTPPNSDEEFNLGPEVNFVQTPSKHRTSRIGKPTMRGIIRGSQDVVRKNVPQHYMQDWFHTLLILRWQFQVLSIFSIYFSVNGIFALLYYIGDVVGGGGNIRGFESSEDYLWLSVQTLTTVGYGRLEPRSQFCQVVASVEATVGILLLSLCSGLVYSIIARPKSRLWFSEAAVIEPQVGASEYRKLHFRLANTRDTSDLYDTHMQVSFGYFVTDNVNGGHKYKMKPLKLQNDGYYPRIGVGVSYYHEINENSPLYTVRSAKWLERCRARLVAVFVCHDGDWSTTTAVHHTYEAKHILFDHLFVNLSTPDPHQSGHYYLDYANFNRTKNIRKLLESMFERIDRTNDGKLLLHEVQAFVHNPPEDFVDNFTIDPNLLLMHFENIVQQKEQQFISRREFINSILRLRKVQVDQLHSSING